MLKKSLLIASGLLMSWCVADGFAQDCYSCGGSQFGYPVARGHGGRIAAHHHARQERWDAWKVEAAKVEARNDAWPKPFACHDRMAYFAVWDPMISQGYANHCILGADHFQSENNHLNQAGKMKVASIMQNLPADRRQLWIVRDQNSSISQGRLDSVNEVVQTFYGQSAPNTLIAFTDRQPATISGIQADTISKRQLEGLPAPIIPIMSAGQGISTATNQ
jgi:hypothetical protein